MRVNQILSRQKVNIEAVRVVVNYIINYY